MPPVLCFTVLRCVWCQAECRLSNYFDVKLLSLHSCTGQTVVKFWKSRALPLLPQHFSFSVFTDESQFRNLIVWLEDQKIRHYKIEDRTALRNICAGDWEEALKKVGFMSWPITPLNSTAVIGHWQTFNLMHMDLEFCIFLCHFLQYLNDVGCPLPSWNRNELVDWIIGYAVRLEYGDNGRNSCILAHW